MDLILDVIQCEQISLTVDGAPPPAKSTELSLKLLLERAGLELIEYSMFKLTTLLEKRATLLPDMPVITLQRTSIQVYSRRGIHAKARANARQ